MAKIRVEIKCPLCDTLTPVVVRKPDHFTPTVASERCFECESTVLARITCHESDRKLVRVQIRGVTASEKAKAVGVEPVEPDALPPVEAG